MDSDSCRDHKRMTQLARRCHRVGLDPLDTYRALRFRESWRPPELVHDVGSPYRFGALNDA